MVKDARRLVRVPIGVDVCAVRKSELRDVEVTVDDGSGERGIENLLHTDLAPLRFPRMDARRGRLLRDVAQCRLGGACASSTSALCPRTYGHPAAAVMAIAERASDLTLGRPVERFSKS